MNSNDPERFNSLAVDEADASVYAIADAQNTTLSIGPINLVNEEQAMLIKYDSWGNSLWSLPIVGSQQETVENIAVGANGNVYVTGTFQGGCYFFNAGSPVSVASLISLSGSKDIYLAAYNANGQFIWAQQFGNNNNELMPDIAVDGTGIALVTQYMGSLSIGSGTSSPSLPSGTHHVALARFSLDGTFQWMVTGGGTLDDNIASVTSDGTRIYVGVIHGNTLFRWYNSANNILASHNLSRNDHQYTAFTTAGAWVWSTGINDPTTNLAGYPNVALGCGAVYIAGSLNAGSSFPNGVAATGSVGNDYFYAARLSAATGSVEWAKVGGTANAGDRFNGRDIAVGKYGLIHIGGTYNGAASFAGSSMTSGIGSDMFIMTLRPDGTLNSLLPINSTSSEYLSSIAADAYGGVAIAGSYQTTLNIPGNPLSGPGNDNGYVAFSQYGTREGELRAPANFNAPGSICSSSGPIDLTTWTTALSRGGATAVVSSNASSNHLNALGPADNIGATLTGGTGSLTLDLGTTVAVGEFLRLRWRRNMSAINSPLLTIQTSTDNVSWTTLTTSLAAPRSTYLISPLVTTAPTRYVRIQATINGGSTDIDALHYLQGTLTGGIWSGVGVSGNTFTPAAIGSTSITYTTGVGSCTNSRTAVVQVHDLPSAGTMSTEYDVQPCPESNRGAVRLDGTSAPVLRWEYSTNNFATSTSIANTTLAQSFLNLTATRSYRALLDAGVCGQLFSSVGTVPILDNQPPAMTCPANITLAVPNGACSASVNYAPPVVTDNCNGLAPDSIAQYTYLGTYQGHTYFRSWASSSWNQANTSATSIPNGHLVTLNSASEEQWINDRIFDQTGSYPPYWTGLNDAVNEGLFVWANGEPLSHTHWAASQPDDVGGADHAYMNTGNSPGWDDAPASTNFGWILEIDALPSIQAQHLSGPVSGSMVPVGVDTVRYSVTDRSGNTSTCRFTISVVDEQPPLILNAAAAITVDATINCSAVATWPEPTATDNCGPTTISRTAGPASGSTFTQGITAITYTATDGAGNTSTSTFNVVVQDSEPPVARCKPDTIGLDANGVASVWPTHVNDGSTDNCGITMMRVEPDTLTSTGLFTVRLIVTDASGNIDSCSTTVTVLPNNCLSDLYLVGRTDGSHIPVGAIRTAPPTRTVLANYDPVTDSDVGHMLKRGDGLLTETDIDRHQIWLFPDSTTSLSGPTSLTIWTAIKDFDADNGGHLRALLIECLANGSGRSVIATANIQRADWHAGPGSWVPETFNFGNVAHSATPGRRIGVMLVVPNTSEDDMWIGYDAIPFPARLSVAMNTAPEIVCPPAQQVLNNSTDCTVPVVYPSVLFSDNCPGASLTLTGGLPSGSVFPLGITTNSYTVTDADGLVANCSFTVEVLDQSAPAITCPSNTSVVSAPGSCVAQVNYTATAADNCSASPTLVWSHMPGTTFPLGTTQVTVHATDGANQSPTCSFSVTVLDQEAPQLTDCPVNIAVNSDPGSCGAHVSFAVTVTDNCSASTSLVWSHQPGSFFPQGTTSVSVQASDGINTSMPCTFTVTVTDVESPSITCPNDTVASVIPGTCSAPIFYAAVATDNCALSPGLIWTHVPGSTFPAGVTTVSVYATDGSNMSATCEFDVTVVDDQPPTLAGCPPDTMIISMGAGCSALMPDLLASFTPSDNCSPAATLLREQMPSAGTALAAGDHLILLRAVDEANNADTCRTLIRVVDNIPPVIFCPADTTLETTTASCRAIVPGFSATVTDNCPGATVAWDGGAFAGDSLVPGFYFMSFRAQDINGTSSSCTFGIEVLDRTPPTIVDRPDTLIELNAAECDHTFSFPTITANDGACGTATYTRGTLILNWSSLTGTPIDVTTTPQYTMPLGLHLVREYWADLAGNVDSTEYQVHIADTVAPIVACPDTVTVVGEANCDHFAPDLLAIATISESCVANVNASIATNEPLTASVVATVQVIDSAGNSGSCAMFIDLVDVDPPQINCTLFDGFPVYLDGSCSAIFPDLTSHVAITDCSAWTVDMLPSAGTVFAADTLIDMTMWVADEAGNGLWNNHVIHVIDSLPPSITCPPDLSVTAQASTCLAGVALPAPLSVLDNCSVLAWNTSAVDGMWPVGDSLVTYSVSDPSGNVGSCAFLVHVVPDTLPDLRYTSPAYCSNNGIISPVEALPAGGTFSCVSCASIGPDGTLDPAMVGAGLHTITYIPQSGSCYSASGDTTTVSIQQQVNAGTSTSTSICSTANPVDLFTLLGGTPDMGGTWYANGNATDQWYSPGTDAPGTYDYTFPASGACQVSTATVTVTENGAPVVSLAYSQAAYCTTAGGSAIPVVTGGSGGTFNSSAPMGAFNSGDGSFNIGSTSPGAYTVTYTRPPANGCAPVQASTMVSVVAAPWAGTSSSASVCTSGSPFDLDAILTGNASGSGTWYKPFAGNAVVANGLVDPINYPGGGTRTYLYVVPGASPCMNDTASVTIDYIVSPTAGTTVPHTICAGTSVVLNELLEGETTGGSWTDQLGNMVSGSATPMTTTNFTYTIQAAPPCNGVAVTVTVTVVQNTSAGSDASVSVACHASAVDLFNVLNDSPTTGGIWSGPSTLNGSQYDPGTMVSGVYTYTVNGNAPCAASSANVIVTRTTPTVELSYPSSSVCRDTISLLPDLAQPMPAGAYFTAPPGVVINTGSGEINILASDTGLHSIGLVMPATCGVSDWFSLHITGPGICGCGASTVDTDGDTTPDCVDGCPNDPLKVAPLLCGCGTPDEDTDNDGTPDCLDTCPTGETSNSINASACTEYTWVVNGQTYTASGTYTHLDDCHTETLVLNIIGATENTTTVSVCDTYTWSANGQTYTASGTYIHLDGCSTETLVLTITPSTTNTTTATACDSYTWSANGQTYTTSGTYTHLDGCSTEILMLTITPSTTNTTTASACGTYTWSVNGQTYTASGTYTHLDGCSTETLVLTITPSTTNTTTASACDTYTWSVNGQTYTASGTYTHLDGCSTETLVLTITPSTTNTTTASACDTYTWSANGQTYTANGTYTHVDGCSTETLVLTITPSTTNTTTASACGSYTWSANNQTYTASGTYTHLDGCSTETLVLTITPSTTNTTTASACGTYTWSANGQTYTASGTYTHVDGCSTETLVLTITPSTTNTTTASACDSYTWSANGQNYTASGTYTHLDGCSTETLVLTITPSTTNTTTASACGTYTWSVNGQTYTASGTYTHVDGCSTETLVLTITPSTTNTTTASDCGTYTWSANGQNYTASGTYTHLDGCSTETLVLTITPSTTNTTTASACGTYTWSVNGQTYTASGTYTHVDGCSTETLVLTITPSTTNTTTASACGTYTWSANGQTYTTSGTYTHVDGCSTETLVLTITPSTTNTTTASDCGSYTWSANGQTYTTSGTYTHVDGCSTETLVLTITPSTTNTTTASACDTYTWSANNQTYTTSGTYIHLDGCSTETLVLTIAPSTTNTTTASACDSYTWSANGQNYTASGTYTHLDGCSTETLVLTITPSTTNTTTASACDTYTWSANGQNYTTSGTYIHLDGCSTETLVLTIAPSTTNTTTASACDSYTWSANGQTYTASGTYTHLDGCSTETLVLTITPSTTNTTTASACDTYNWNVNGQTYTTSGTYTHVDGCSTETLVLTITPSTTTTTTASACDTYTWSANGQTYTASGTYTHLDGCHTEMLVLSIHSSPTANAGPDLSVCGYELALQGILSTGSGSWSIPNGFNATNSASPTTVINGNTAGTFDLIWNVVENGCWSTDTAHVTLHDPAVGLLVDAGPDQLLEVETSTTLNAMVSAGASVHWSTIGGTGSLVSPDDESTPVHGLSLGQNTFVVQVSLGECPGGQDTIMVIVKDLFIPEGFSPNGDGVNDRFEVTGMAAYPNSSLEVFNRWGQKVYTSSAYGNEWDGRADHGAPLADDTYFYVLNLSGDEAYNGFVVIKR